MTKKFSNQASGFSLFRSAVKAVVAGILVTATTGCSTLLQPIDGVPANRLPQEFFAEPKNDLVPVDISLLSLEPPRDDLSLIHI